MIDDHETPQADPIANPVLGLVQAQLDMQMLLWQNTLHMQQMMLGQAQQMMAGLMPQPQLAGQQASEGQQAGPQLPFNMSPEVLQRLMQLDASPKTLNLLQRTLDFVFDAYAGA